jgi:hypothetical protein
MTVLANHYLRFLITLLFLFTMTGCAIPDALLIKAPASAPINANLAAALAHSPAPTEYFAYSDWTVIKEVAGITDLNSTDSMEERLAFILPLAVDEQALAAAFGNNYFYTHAETWGWDSTDLLWEANLTSNGPPIFILRFRDDFDFAPVFARLDERGYNTSELGGVTLYSHAMDMSADWLGTSEFAILNIAFLENEKLFILSSSLDTVTSVLDAIDQGETLANLPAVRSVAAELGDAGAVILSPLGCQLLDVTQVVRGSTEILEALIGEMERSGISGLYTVFGLGYRVEVRDGESLPLGVFVHHYPIAAQAAAEFELRRLVAETAKSLATNAPYGELFEVVDAKVVDAGTSGANLVLSLHALDRPPQLFINMFNQRDLLFSMCAAL